MDEFIYSILSPHNAYKYLDFNIKISDGYLYLKASDKLTVRPYLRHNSYVFKNIILLRQPVQVIEHLLITCTQSEFNVFMCNNIVTEDLIQQRYHITKAFNPDLKGTLK